MRTGGTAMTHVQKRGLCWLIAGVMTAALMAFVLLCTDVTFAANDDSSIMRAFMGYESGDPARVHLFIHGLLAQPLALLGTWFPGLPWFTYVQLALLALSAVVIAKSIMQSFVKHGRSMIAGALMAASFLLILCLKYMTLLTFTQTAAMLGAAAAAQLMSIEHERGAKHVIVGVAGALALVCLSYALRQNALLPMLAFCGLIFLAQLWECAEKKLPLRPMFISLAMIALVLGGMVGFRSLELSRPDMQDYLRWQEANTEIMDYTGIRSIPQEGFDAVGWDENDLAMAERWCFLSPDISTEAFQTLTEYVHEADTATIAQRLEKAWKLFCQTAAENRQDMRALVIAGFAALCCVALACCERKPRQLFSMLGMIVLAAAMTAYLAMEGRLPLRALLIALLPPSAFFFAVMPEAISAWSKKVPPVFYAVILLTSLICASEIVPGLLIDEEEQWNSGNALTDLEEYAVYEPESLFLYDMSLTITDMRAFPPFPDGVPHNVSFWGGWPLRSPQSIQQFANYDIDLMNFQPEDLLRDNVYVASATIDPPPTVLLDWLRTEVSPDIECELYSEYGYVYIFQFCEY